MAISLFQKQRQKVNGEWCTVRVYNGSIGAGSTLTIHTPSSATNKVWLVGLSFCSDTPTNLTWNSGASEIVTWKLAANQGAADKVSEGTQLNTKVNEALTLTSSADVSSILISVVEAEVL